MRIAVVAMETSHFRKTAGRERVERVATHLAEAGHEVTVFCSRWWEDESPRFSPGSVTYRAVTDAPAGARFWMRLPTALAWNRPDLVYAIPEPPSVLLAAKVGAALARAPLVVEWFGDETMPDGRVTRSAVRAPSCLVTPSELVRTRLRERGAPDDRTTVLPESIDMDLVREVEPDDEVDVVYAHRLDESANINALFLGLAELRQKDWSATVIGDGPKRQAYQQEARDLRIDDRVEFVGACDRERRVSIYKGAHVFVQTAFREYFATELLWAMACGCLGIVEYQAKSSAHELIEQHDRTFRVTTPQEIADRIVASADYERKHVDESWASFDHDAVREDYEDLFDRLVDAHGLF